MILSLIVFAVIAYIAFLYLCLFLAKVIDFIFDVIDIAKSVIRFFYRLA